MNPLAQNNWNFFAIVTLIAGLIWQIDNLLPLPLKPAVLTFAITTMLMNAGIYLLSAYHNLKYMKIGAVLSIAGIIVHLIMLIFTNPPVSSLVSVVSMMLRVSGTVFIFINLWQLKHTFSPQLILITVIAGLAVQLCWSFMLLPDNFCRLGDSIVNGLIAWLFYEQALYSSQKVHQ